MLNQTFSILILVLLTASCFIKPSDSHKELWSEDRIDEFIVDWMVKNNKGSFDWNVAPDIMLYSALIHGDSMLYIDYKVTPDGPSTIKYSSTDVLQMPDEWIERRDNLTDYILKQERKYRKQPDLTLYDLLPWSNKKVASDFPHLTIQVTNPTIIYELRKDETIVLIQPGYYHRSYVIMEKLKERRLKGYRYKKQKQ